MAHAAQHLVPAAAPKLLYRVHEAREALGLSTATIYRLCARGELVKAPIGGTRSVGITAASVNAMLARMSPPVIEEADKSSPPSMGS